MKNKSSGGILAALTIGISAMLAMQTPITAYATDLDENPNPTGNDPESTGSSEAGTEVGDPVVEASEVTQAFDSVIEEANDVIEAVSDPTPAEGETAPAADEDMNDTANAAAELILSGDATAETPIAPAGSATEGAQEGSASVDAAVEALIDAASLVDTPVVDDAGEITETSVNHDLLSAEANVMEAKSDLQDAEDLSKDVDKQNAIVADNAATAVDKFNDAFDYADNMTSTVESVETTITNKIADYNASEDEDERTTLLSEINQLYSETAETVGDWNSGVTTSLGDYDSYVERAETAQLTLDEKQDDLSDKLESAKTNASEATADVEKAQGKVDDIKESLDAVQDSLEDGADATSISKVGGGSEWSNLTDVSKSRSTMITVVKDYYLDQLLSKDGNTLVSITGEQYIKELNKTTGKESLDKQEYNYYEVNYTYKDADGVEHEGTKYFNWAYATKSFSGTEGIDTGYATRNYHGVQSVQGIMIYEKTADEINANEHILNYVKEHGDTVIVEQGSAKTVSQIVKSAISGKKYRNDALKAFSYVDADDVTQYISYFELAGLTDAATNDVATTSTTSITLADGSTVELKEVVQNQNDLLHDGTVSFLEMRTRSSSILLRITTMNRAMSLVPIRAVRTLSASVKKRSQKSKITPWRSTTSSTITLLPA